MSVKQRTEAQLKHARGFSEGLLKAFKTPEQWTHQVHENANHALWFAGHMGTVDNFMISLIDPAKCVEKDGYNEKFGMGSQPTSNPADYPPVDEVLDFMRERRIALMALLDSLNEADFTKPTPESAPDFLPDYGSVFQICAWHEGLHSGQVTVARRALGNEPIAG